MAMNLLRPSRLGRQLSSVIVCAATFGACAATLPAQTLDDAAPLAARFKAAVQPLLAQYCGDCHSADLAEGDVDFSRLATWPDAASATQQWQLVDEMLRGRIMPPADAAQPSDEQRTLLLQWLRDYLTLQSRQGAGDPGPVVLRRLCNAEYAYTIRDLTGVAALDPGREFPADGAAGEGFANVGNALAMSPALATKYLDAAKEVAAHAVLLPDGIAFSPATTRRDWTTERLAAIRRLYAKYADAGGGDEVNVQGVVFTSNEGGRLPVERYLAALLHHRESLAAGSVTIADVATTTNLSPKYLAALWSMLIAREPSLLLDEIRVAWRAAQPNDESAPAALTSLIREWQCRLWKFNVVGHIGKVGGPASWLEPVSPLVAREEIERRLPNGAADNVADAKWEADADAFRQLFPAALCYATIVPVDEAVTLTLYHREDDHLSRLMLSDAERAELDRLWSELHFISQDALAKVDALAQLIEYATQDADPSLFTPLREPYAAEAAAFRQQLLDAEPRHVDAVVAFAARAYRRPLTELESGQLRRLYATLRAEELDHDAAIRLVLARVLAAPAFLYRLESSPAGQGSAPVSEWELAARLSYFLWSSAPDDRLRELAAAGRLSDPSILAEQTRRLLADDRIDRLASEFGRQWLQIRGFEMHDEKSESRFPMFAALREAMAQESTLFLTDLFQHDRSLLSLLDADHTFLTEALAAHYGVPNVSGPEWRRVEGVRRFGRGGILTQAATLAATSGASRTSPILRGVWISEVLLGERLPKPPAGVPPLPDDQAASDELTVRQLVERHVSDPNCSVCHRRIDPYGFALEAYDAIGRRRQAEPNGQPIDAQSVLLDGTELAGVDGLRNYLVETRRDGFVRQFCKKLLGFALGRSVLLTDEPLLADMQAALKANDYRVGVAVEAIVQSRQFQEIRGGDATAAN
jgi:hypothetical protein